MANVIIVDVYDFAGVGNKYVGKQQGPLVVSKIVDVVPITRSPDPTVYVYSCIKYAPVGGGMIEDNYTAETVAQITTKMNA